MKMKRKPLMIRHHHFGKGKSGSQTFDRPSSFIIISRSNNGRAASSPVRRHRLREARTETQAFDRASLSLREARTKGQIFNRPPLFREARTEGPGLRPGRKNRPQPLPPRLSAKRGQARGSAAIIRGAVKEGNFVVTASPALRPSAERKRLRRGYYWPGRRPGPSGVCVDIGDGQERLRDVDISTQHACTGQVKKESAGLRSSVIIVSRDKNGRAGSSTPPKDAPQKPSRPCPRNADKGGTTSRFAVV